MNKQWIIKNTIDQQLVNSIAHDLNIDEIVARLLIDRGITTKEDAQLFFSPSLDDLYDPFLMTDMDKAIRRIEEAINANEKILVYGDYDVDGTTSVALMYTFLKEILNFNVDFYIPDRFSEGYGISQEGIEYAAENDCSLIIALDCGIKAINHVKDAQQKGIDFIICDHHTPDDELPDAVAVLDPKRDDCKYPCDYLTGCGVGFKLIQAIAQSRNIPFEKIHGFLDLVAVSIASDIVPILDENRILAVHGLEVLERNPRLGLRKIKEYAGLDSPISISDIVFKIGPRINASGRVGSANDSVRLLIAQNEIEAANVARKLEEMNEYRKNLDQNITQEAMKIVENTPTLKNAKAIVAYQKNWNKGVLGIVASRLVEKFYKPSIVLSYSEGKITGSARSIEDFDLYNAISQCEDLLDNYGGHKYAAGLTLSEQKLKVFTDKFLQVVDNMIKDDQFIPKIKVDSKMSLKNITKDFCDALQQFKPFGPKNLKPVFVTENIIDYGYSRMVGRNNEHLKLVVTSYDSVSEVKNGIAFSQGHYYEQISKGNPFDICYSLQENDFWGKQETQLLVRDLKLK